MAKVQVLREPPPPPPEPKPIGYMLSLSPEEAQAIVDVGWLVGGNPDGPRGDFDAVCTQLRPYLSPRSNLMTGSIYFKDGE